MIQAQGRAFITSTQNHPMSDISIRSVTTTDIDDLYHISRTTFLESFSAGNTAENMQKYMDDALSVTKLTDELNNPDSVFYLALHGKSVIGYLKLNIGSAQTEFRNDNNVEIERIYVLREFYGKKAGQLLYEKAIQFARQRNAEYIWLGVWEQNPRAIRFYEKNGFETVGTHIFRLGDDEQTDMIMRRMLWEDTASQTARTIKKNTSKDMDSIHASMFAELQDKTIFHKAVEFGCHYIDAASDRNVFPSEEALEHLGLFDESIPYEPANAIALLEQLHTYGGPATVTSIGGRYFGFVNGSVVPAAMAAKILGTFWNQNTAMYVMSPVAAKLERVVERWLRSLFNFPEETVAGFVSGTSTANLCALVAARFRLLKNQGWDINKQGLFNAPPVRVIAGKEAHSSIIRTISLVGFGSDNIEFIDTDDQGRILPECIPELNHNTLLILSAGNVNSGSFDNFSEICKRAKHAGAWVHVDGAFGLWAGASARLAHLTSDVEYANSWALDAHKTLNTPYDCGIVLCNDKEALTGALHASGGYLVFSEDRDGMCYTPEMSRRARIMELWATIKYLGISGLDQMVFGMHERAVQFERELSAIDGFAIVNDVVFNQVLVACETDDITLSVMQEVQEERVCWVGGSTWRGRRVIRISVCAWATTTQDVTRSVQSFKSALERVMGRKPRGEQRGSL